MSRFDQIIQRMHNINLMLTNVVVFSVRNTPKTVMNILKLRKF